MEITLELDKTADISFLKNLFSQLKGIKNVHFEEDKTYSWDEIESSPEFRTVMEQGREDIKNGKGGEMTSELMDTIFRSK